MENDKIKEYMNLLTKEIDGSLEELQVCIEQLKRIEKELKEEE